MNSFTLSLTCALALAAGQKADNTDRQNRQDENYRRLEIYNGPYRSVHYFPNNPSDREAYRNLEHAENESLLAQELQNLRRQYIRDEVLNEANRSAVQQRLYGMNFTRTLVDNSSVSSFSPNNGMSSFTPLTSPVSASGFPLGGQITGTTPFVPHVINNRLITPNGTTTISPNGAFPNGVTQFGTAVNPNFAGQGQQTQTTPTGFTSFTPGSNGMTTALSGISGPVVGGSPFLGGSTFTNGGGFFNPFGFGGGLGVGASTLFGGGGSLFGGAGTFNPYFSLYGNYFASSSQLTTTVNESLANGVGDEGKLKAMMAAAMAQQSMPSSQAVTQANLQAARDAVRKDRPYVTVHLRSGEVRRGMLKEKTAEWMVLRDGPDEHYIRYSDVSRMTKSKPPALTSTAER
jgi:hypothetical protein